MTSKLFRVGKIIDVEYVTPKGEKKQITVVTSVNKLKVTNNTTFPVYCSVYFRKKNQARPYYYRMNDPIIVHPEDTARLRKPSFNCIRTYKARIFFSSSESNLPECLFGGVIDRISSHSVYLCKQLHICCQRGLLCAFSPFHWAHKDSIQRTNESLVSKKNRISEVFSHDYSYLLEDHSNRNVPEMIRTAFPRPLLLENFRRISSSLVTRPGRAYIPPSMPLGDEEQQALLKRTEKVKKSICNFLGESEEYLEGKIVPRISVCFSGGSYRALVSVLGYMRGWQNIGFLDCVTYISTLSGSCWGVALWLVSGNNLDDTIRNMATKLSLSFSDCMNSETRNLLSNYIKQRKALKLPTHRLMDLYSVLIASQLLNDVPNGFLAPFSTLRKSSRVDEGEVPIPIFTSVFKEPHGYEWLEITPFEVGGEYIGAFVPVESFGCGFKEGQIYKVAPEISLATVMSFTTSAICLTTRNLLKQIFGEIALTSAQWHKNIAADTILEFSDAEDFSFSDDDDYGAEAISNSEDDMAFLNARHTLYDSYNVASSSNFYETELSSKDGMPDLDSLPSLGNLSSISRISNTESKQESSEYSNVSTASSQNSKSSRKQKLGQKVFKLINEYDWLADAYIISPTTFPNFAYRLEGPMRATKYLRLVDAGFGFCLPMPPLVRQCRHSHILVVIEMSAPPECERGASLLSAAKWCKEHEVKFPPIDPEMLRVPFGMNNEQIRVFEDPSDPNVPTIVYVLLQKNSEYGSFDPIQNQREGGFCNTFCKSMTAEQIQTLAGLTTFTATQMEETLRAVIRRKIELLNS